MSNSLRQSNERWIDITIRVAAVGVVALIAYIGFTYGYQVWAARQNSPATRAIDALAAIVRGKPQDPALRVRLAEALAADGRTDEAVGQLRAALVIDKGYVPALVGLGKVAMLRKEYKTAEGYWLKIIDALSTGQTVQGNTNLDEAYYGLGVTYLETRRYEEAVEAFKSALSVRKDASDSHYMLSVAYRELGLPDKQKQELDITLAFDPNNAQASYDRGLLALRAGDTATAAELFRIAADHTTSVDLPGLELDKLAAKSTAVARLAKARNLEKRDPAVALTEARIGAALEPRNIEAVRLVARLWEANKDPAKAANAWQRLLEIVPTDAEAKAAVKRLETSGSK